MNDYTLNPNLKVISTDRNVIPQNQGTSSKIGTQVGKTGQAVAKFFQIAQGAVKRVWIAQSPNPHGTESKTLPATVFYTAIPSLFKRKEKELKDEVKIMKNVEAEVKTAGGSTENLAVTIVFTGKKIGGKYTVEVPKAEGDFEKEIRDPKTTVKERVEFGGQLLRGMANLHLAKYVYGDTKAENSMIYIRENPGTKKQEKVLKVGDFGKAQSVSDEKETKSYKGNSRHCPPERVASQKGDVYGTAIDLIRNFEEALLVKMSKTTLVDVSKTNFDQKASSKLRGIEAYVVEHKDVPASNPGLSIKSLMSRLKFGKTNEKDMKKQEQAIHAYIDALETGYRILSHEDGGVIKSEGVKKLCELLKKMTLSDSNRRISMNDASELYQVIEKSMNG